MEIVQGDSKDVDVAFQMGTIALEMLPWILFCQLDLDTSVAPSSPDNLVLSSLRHTKHFHAYERKCLESVLLALVCICLNSLGAIISISFNFSFFPPSLLKITKLEINFRLKLVVT